MSKNFPLRWEMNGLSEGYKPAIWVIIIGFFSLLLVHNAKVSSLIFIDFLFDVFLPYDCLNYCLYENITWKCFSFGPLDNISSDLILKTIFSWIFPAFFSLIFFSFTCTMTMDAALLITQPFTESGGEAMFVAGFFPFIFLSFFFSRFTDSEAKHFSSFSQVFHF